jgi:predicted GIY-YIG superfamily endonuclease
VGGFVYLIRLAKPLGNLKHKAWFYLGSTIDLDNRMEQHRSGRGAAMLRAANEQGIEYEIIKVVTLPSSHQARLLEVRLKSRKNHRSLLTLDWQEKMDESINLWIKKGWRDVYRDCRND